ncbi:hypothetical protein [Halorubrum sp. AS12]|uniref:hypothetical protein n=1 Tax=Halorubrum sp. AS12 TaxID=3409687 RepID=UPI003DA7073B
MSTTPPRPEHRTLDPETDDVERTDGHIATRGFYYKLRCTACRPFYTLPVRKPGDPPTVARCAQCGRKHSMDSVEITKHDRYE